MHLQPELDVSKHLCTSKATGKKVNELMRDIGLIDTWKESCLTQGNTHYSALQSVAVFILGNKPPISQGRRYMYNRFERPLSTVH